MAGAATSEDRQTDNQTDRRQHHQTPSITSNLRRGEACSTRDVIVPLGTGSRLTRKGSASLKPAGFKHFFFLDEKEQGIQKPAALYRTRPAPAFRVNGPFLSLKRKGRNDWISTLLLCGTHHSPSIVPSPFWVAVTLVGTHQSVNAASLPPFLSCEALLH